MRRPIGLLIARVVMTRNSLTVTPQTTIAEAWDVMRELAVLHVPVVEDGALVGVLSDPDLAQVGIARLEHKIGAVPVVEEGTREVLGIISYVDVLRALQNLVEED